MANASPRGGTEGEQLGSYRLVRKLGRGGMGEVWLAEHDTIKSQVAIKLVLAAPDDEDAASRFLREAKATARIRHPGVVTVSDFGPRPAGGAYLVMELLDGESLSDRIERGALSSDLAIDLGVQIAEALAAAHASGVIHRDLKPANIFLVRDAATRSDVRVKLVDFGVAKATGKVTDELGMTVTGALVGTPVYMAPEQCSSRRGQIDERADLYALGVVLYEIVTGKPPFRGPTLGDLIDQHLNETPTTPRTVVPSIPAKLDVLIMTLLAKDRADRPASANDVARVLHELRGTTPSPVTLDDTMGSGTHPKAVSLDETMASGALSAAPPQGDRVAAISAAPTRVPRKIPRVAIAAAGAVALVLVVVVVMLVRGGKKSIDHAKATDVELDDACRGSDANACFARARRDQRLVKPDLASVALNLRAACSLGHQTACAYAAWAFMWGAGVKTDYARARKLADGACTANDALGCEIAGDIQSFGLGEPPDRAKALATWERACRLGAMGGCESAGSALIFGLGVPRDKERGHTLQRDGFAKAQAACAKDDPAGCLVVGHVHARGYIVERDDTRATASLERACELGSADACGEVGEFYAIGRGVAKDDAKAKAYLQRSCDHGSGMSCATLGIAIANGIIGKEDPAAGLAIVKDACGAHGEQPCGILGNFYQIGVGTPQDFKLAAVMYERACRAGYADACASLAEIHVPGVPRDETKVEALLVQACSLGSAGACQSAGKRAKKREAYKEAFDYFEIACALSDFQIGCENVSDALFDGQGTAADPVRAKAVLVDGCGGSASISCYNLGVRLRDGKGLPANVADALGQFEKSCDLGYGKACVAAADLLSTPSMGLTTDERRASMLRNKACMVEARLCPKPAGTGSGSASGSATGSGSPTSVGSAGSGSAVK